MILPGRARASIVKAAIASVDSAAMRILHVIGSLDPALGGPPMVAACLAAAQASLGHESQILSYHSDGADERMAKAMERINPFKAVQRQTLPPPAGLEKILARDARRNIPAHLNGVQFVHIHGVWEPILKAAADCALQQHIPYVVAPHGMLDPWSLRQRRLKKKLALALGYQKMLNQAAFLHVLNGDEQKLLEPLGVKSPTEVISNGVFLEEIEPLPAAGSFRAAHPELSDDPYILFLSRLHYKKGLDYLADAFALVIKEHAAARLVVAGPDGGAEKDFARQVNKLKLDDRVHIVGPLYGADKFAALVDAAAFCLPSRQEGFSVAVTEALACGVPVVISDACHFPEVEEAGAGLVVPLEPARIASALLQILQDSTLRAGMGAAGAALVRKRYTWPKIGQTSIDAYRQHLTG